MFIDKFKKILDYPACYDFAQAALGYARYQEKVQRSQILPLTVGKSNVRILDVGCGTASILSHLNFDLEYVGIDVSSRYLEVAEKRALRKGIASTFIIHDFEENGNDWMEKFRSSKPVDIILLFGVLHHLSNSAILSFLEKLKEINAFKGATMITADPVFFDEQSRISRYIAENDRGDFVRHHKEYEALIDKSLCELISSEIISSGMLIPSNAQLMKIGI